MRLPRPTKLCNINSITDATVTVAAATQMTALAKFDGVYTVSDTVANLVGETAAADVDRLNAAVSVTVADSVANLEAANGVTTIAAATTDNVAVTDTLANLTTSRTGGTAVRLRPASLSVILIWMLVMQPT